MVLPLLGFGWAVRALVLACVGVGAAGVGGGPYPPSDAGMVLRTDPERIRVPLHGTQVTVERLRELAPRLGRRHQPAQARQGPDRAPDRRPTGPALDNRAPQPRLRLRFDAKTDGPWPRSPAEFAVQLDRLSDLLPPLLARVEAGLAPQRMTRPEAYLTGVWGAARWTLAVTNDPPLPVAVAGLDTWTVDLMTVCARTMTRKEGPPGCWHAAGVAAWLEWLTGLRDDIAYPSR